MRNLLAQLLAVGPELAAYIFTVPLPQLQGVTAQFTQTAVSSPNLRLQDLGRVAIGGDFDSISLYTYDGQNENLSSNGSQSLLTRYPDGAFQSLGLVDADASIAAMCPFIAKDGTDQGIIVAGNFTSFGGVAASSIAIWHPDSGDIEPLAGLTGPVRAVYCDPDLQTVYVGGNFMAGNSTNAMAWTTGWVNLPFAGFNGPVNSIVKNSAGNIVFGGEFNGLGNATTPSEPDAQVVNLGGGTISVSTPATASGSSQPSSIICSTAESGNQWLLPDNTAGWWGGSYGYGFVPTKLRLYNANQDGRGTKTFYFERLDDGGILNFTYVDSSTGQTQSCIQACPMPENNSTAQDFHFVNPVGVSGFRIWITSWYGASGGLSGIEMFQDDLYSYAVNDFNEPRCDGVSNGSSSTNSPANTWTRVANKDLTTADFLSATLTSEDEISSDTNVVFMPNIQQSGNYSVTVYTPGCILDGTCATRGQVNMTGSLTVDQAPITTTLYQTNNYDKFDQIYYGYIDTENFRPTVTLTPLLDQAVPLTVVASRVRFELINSTGGLNGLFEYNPNEATVDTDFTKSAIDAAGASLNSGAIISELAMAEDTIYAAGNFSGNGMSNIMSITDKANALPGGGLNGAVIAMQLNDTSLYIGGTFDNTADNSATGLNNLAVFSTSGKTWSPVGAGVDGSVFSIVPLDLNITTGDLRNCFAITGNFSSVYAFSGNQAFDASGFAVWIPSLDNWLNNVANATIDLTGQLTTYTTAPDTPTLYAGSITSQGMDLSDAVELVGSDTPSIQALNIQLQRLASNTTSAKHRRALSTQSSSGQNYTGVYDGYFYQDNGLNITVLGGSFSATASDRSTVSNLVFINETGSEHTVSGVSGLSSDSIIVSMDTYETVLFAGGAIDGTVNGNDATGLIAYDLAANAYPATHPPPLGGGDDIIVNAIATQPDSSLVFVGGHFQTAGGLQCGTLCSWDAKALQWQAVGFGLSGTINAMFWSSKTQLFIAGNLTVSDNKTTMATYDSKKQTFEAFQGASDLPGPIYAVSAVNNNYDEFWAAGIATSNSSAYLSKYANGNWTGVGGLGAPTSIRKLQIMPLSSDRDNDVALMAKDQALLILGNINVPDQGNASAVLFNGTTYEPYVLTSMNDGSEGSLSAIFVSNPAFFMEVSDHHLALGLVVLIGLAISLAIIALMVLAGILLERHRRLREGYVPMSVDKSSNIARLPPETLFSNLEGKSNPPKL